MGGSTTVSASTTNALTINNSGSGAASGSTFNGGSALTISYNTVGASPLAGSTSLTTLGTITTGVWNGSTIPVAYGGTGVTSATGIGAGASVVLNQNPAINSPVITAYSTSTVPLKIYGLSGQFTELFDVYTYSGGTLAFQINSSGAISTGIWNASVIGASYGGTGVAGTLTGVLYGNGTSAHTVATAAQLVSAIGSTAVTNSTNTTNVLGGAANQIVYNTGSGATNFITAPTASGTYLEWNGSGFVWATPGGGGTVTSVALSLPSIFTVSGSPVTSSGTLTGSLATQSANLVFAGPSSGSAATPTFRSLVAADIPALSYAPTTGSTSITTLGTITTGTWNGSVLGAAYGGTGEAGTLTGILYGNGTSAYTVATNSQLLSLLGTLGIANGGTGQTSFTSGQIHYGSFSTSSNLYFNGTQLGLGTNSPSSQFAIIPGTTPTTVAGCNQITIGESTNNSGYQLAIGFGNLSSYGGYTGIIQSTAGGNPSALVLNPNGGTITTGSTFQTGGPLYVETTGGNSNEVFNVNGTALTQAFSGNGNTTINSVYSGVSGGGGLCIIRGADGYSGGSYVRVYAVAILVAGGAGTTNATLVSSANTTASTATFAFAFSVSGSYVTITSSGFTSYGGAWRASFIGL